MKSFFYFIYTILLSISAIGVVLPQNMPDLPPKHLKLYKPDRNHLICADTTVLALFWNKLDSLAEGADKQVHIMHIGDSHIQADLFSGRIRQLLFDEKLFPVAGRGVIFPYQLAKTNNPSGYQVTYTGSWEGCRNAARDRECQWGLAGITATTRDADAIFTLKLGYSASLRHPFKRVKIFYPTHDAASFGLRCMADNIVSDSVYKNAGYQEFIFKDSLAQVSFQVKQRDSAQRYFTMQGISLESDRRGVVYSSLGVNGAEVVSFLKSPDLDKNLKVVKPDMVIISLGTNDAYMPRFDEPQFRLSLGRLIQRVKMAVPQAVVLLTTPGDSYYRRYRPNRNMIKAVKQTVHVAEETGAVVWDFYAVMGGFRSVQRWYAHGLAQKDRLHLSAKGYQLQGDLLYTAIMRAWKAHRKQKQTNLSK